MAAYAALISLKNTIHHILNSSRISIIHPSPEIIQRAYKGLQPLLEILRSSSSSRNRKIMGLDEEIRDAVCEFEYLLLSLLSHQIIASSHSQSSHPSMEFSIDLQDLQRHVDSFVNTMKKMEEDYVNESDDDEDEDFPSSNVLKMVGFLLNG